MARPSFIIGDYGLSVTFFVKKIQNGVAVPRDISTSTSQAVQFTNPTGSVIEKSASFVTDGTDGGITYVIEEGLLNQEGPWDVRGKVTTGTTQEFRTDKIRFDVRD